MELAGLAEECKEQLRSTCSDETLMTDEEEDLPSFDLPDSVESACALGKLNIDDRVRVLEELKSREMPAGKSNIKQIVDQLLPSPPKVQKLSYSTIRNGIDAIVRQAEFFDTLNPDRISEWFHQPGQREQTVEALKKMIGILEKQSVFSDEEAQES